MTDQPAAMRRPTIAESEDMKHAMYLQGVPMEVAERAAAAVFRAGFRCDSAMTETIRAAKHDAWDEGYGDCWTYHRSEGAAGTQTNPYQ